MKEKFEFFFTLSNSNNLESQLNMCCDNWWEYVSYDMSKFLTENDVDRLF